MSNVATVHTAWTPEAEPLDDDDLPLEHDLDYSKARPNRYAGQIDWSQDVIVLDDETAPDAGSTVVLGDRDEYPEVTQADLDRATFRIGLNVLVPKGADGDLAAAIKSEGYDNR